MLHKRFANTNKSWKHMNWIIPTHLIQCSSGYVVWDIVAQKTTYNYQIFSPRQPKTTGGWWRDTQIFIKEARFDSQSWNLLDKKTCKVVNCPLCFGVGMSTFCLKKERRKKIQGWFHGDGIYETHCGLISSMIFKLFSSWFPNDVGQLGPMWWEWAFMASRPVSGQFLGPLSHTRLRARDQYISTLQAFSLVEKGGRHGPSFAVSHYVWGTDATCECKMDGLLDLHYVH